MEAKSENAKKDVLLAVLSRSWAWLHLDGRVEGVELPEWLRIPSVTLQIGYDMPVPIPDLAIDEGGVTATLSFQRTPHTCRIPWKAVFAIADFDGRGALFADDMPAELGAGAPTGSSEVARAGGPTVVADPDPTSGEGAAEGPSEPARFKSGRPRPSHLKLVN